MEMDRREAMLMELLKETKTIVEFLDSVFGFLSRRTDFYHLMRTETDSMGFPPGVREQLVFNALKKHDKIKREQIVEATPFVAEQIEIESFEELSPQLEKKERTELENSEDEKSFQLNEYYNGATYDNYCWGQSINDVEVHIHLPKHINMPKLLSVKIEPDYISISEQQNQNNILQGKLSKKCKSNDIVWSLSGGKLQITIDKMQEVWWDRFLESEPVLDLSKMDCSRSIDELPEESQAVIEKLRWDQQQKLLGLATSDELKNSEILRAAWDAEGSPFKGQPFDPSIVNFN